MKKIIHIILVIFFLISIGTTGWIFERQTKFFSLLGVEMLYKMHFYSESEKILTNLSSNDVKTEQYKFYLLGNTYYREAVAFIKDSQIQNTTWSWNMSTWSKDEKNASWSENNPDEIYKNLLTKSIEAYGNALRLSENDAIQKNRDFVLHLLEEKNSKDQTSQDDSNKQDSKDTKSGSGADSNSGSGSKNQDNTKTETGATSTGNTLSGSISNGVFQQGKKFSQNDDYFSDSELSGSLNMIREMDNNKSKYLRKDGEKSSSNSMLDTIRNIFGDDTSRLFWGDQNSQEKDW